ncbi:MAG: FHA domain-containing protein, partial [Planctomicrobium sp.]|nr:FHA domain-containing protein [Planctomicrobium sp.]
MWQLIAQGPEPRQRWKLRLEKGRQYSVGRSAECDSPATWEPQLSRKHLTLEVFEEFVNLNVHPTSRNPVFVHGEELKSGTSKAPDKFIVGKTAFYLNKVAPTSDSPDAPFQELTFTHQELQQVHFADADRRLEALARLPEVIDQSTSREESATKLVSLILAGVRYAEAAAVVSLDQTEQVEVHAWERRSETEGVFRPSIRLLKEALGGKKTVLHVWEKSPDVSQQYTMAAEFDWAFCVPLQISEQERWCVYVAGQLDSPFIEENQIRQNIQSDVRFAQLVGEVICSSQRMNRMEGQLSVLRRFLSPPILTALEETGQHHELNIDLLKPRESDVTVLFCDLRGFSQKAEVAADDLTGLLNRVSGALEVMSR